MNPCLWAATCMLLTLAASGAQPATVWLFDLGTDASPVWPGFTRVTPQAGYSPERGHGWLVEADRLRAHTATNLDALSIDEISGSAPDTINFRVDVPNGKYSVWVLTGTMGNIWRLRYLRVPHEWLVQGRLAATVDYGENELFRVANYDWDPRRDLWDDYIRPRFRWLRAEVDATEGNIVLGFRKAIDFPVNAIVIANRNIADRVQREMDRIDDTRRQAFHQIWHEERIEPQPRWAVSATERRRGFVAAGVHCSDDAFPWSRPAPTANRERIEFFATPGEQEQASFAVYALRDLEDVTFSLGEMRAEAGVLPTSAFRPGLVQFAPWHAGPRDTPGYTIKECLILPLRPTFVGANTCKRFWITLNTPPDARPGMYRGIIEISAENAPPAQLELAVRVLPVKLDTPPVERYMYFGTMYFLGRAYLPVFDEKRFWDAMRAEVRFMRDNQHCRAQCIVPRGSAAVKVEDGRVVDVDLRDTARLMQILREENAWPRDNTMICQTGPFNIRFGGHFYRPDNPTVKFVPEGEGRERFAQTIEFIDKRARAEGWPEIAFECLGEFSNYREAGKTFAVQVHTLFNRLGVGNTIRGNGPSDMAPIEMGLVKYPQPNWAMMFPEQLSIMRRTGKRLWAYNFARSRFSMGWFCFRHGISRAGYESGVYANGQPGNVFEIPTMFPMGLPTSMTTIRPTVWLKRLVQGAVDYEYLYTLDRRISAARRSKRKDAVRIAREARAWLDRKLADIPAGSTYVQGDPRSDRDVQGTFWPVHDLDRYRWQAARFLMDLETALGKHE